MIRCVYFPFLLFSFVFVFYISFDEYHWKGQNTKIHLNLLLNTWRKKNTNDTTDTLWTTEDCLLDKNDAGDKQHISLITKDRTKLTPTKHEWQDWISSA